MVISKPVLEELDALKSREGGEGYAAREASRQIENLIHASQKIAENKWHVSRSCVLQIDGDSDYQISQYGSLTCDDRILETANIYTKNFGAENAVWLVTLDRNLPRQSRSEKPELPEPGRLAKSWGE